MLYPVFFRVRSEGGPDRERDARSGVAAAATTTSVPNGTNYTTHQPREIPPQAWQMANSSFSKVRFQNPC